MDHQRRPVSPSERKAEVKNRFECTMLQRYLTALEKEHKYTIKEIEKTQSVLRRQTSKCRRKTCFITQEYQNKQVFSVKGGGTMSSKKDKRE